jgi:hypothetical protein
MYEKMDSSKYQLNVRNLMYSKIRNTNKFNEDTKEIQKKNKSVCKKAKGVELLK